MNEKILMLAQGVYEDEINLKHEIYLRFYLNCYSTQLIAGMIIESFIKSGWLVF